MTDRNLTQLLSELIAIPSVNPEDAVADEPCSEIELAHKVAAYLYEKGFETDYQDVRAGRPNIIARFGPSDACSTILFEAHLDTVGVQGMKDPFSPCIEQGCMYGRGACDDKGPMAAALHAMAPDVLAQLAHKGVQIIFIGAMGEETGNLGALALEELALQVDQAVVLEPTELDLVHAHKGACWMEIELSGVAAHGAHPEQGFNAVASAGPVIHALQEMIQADRDAVSSPLLGGPTLNIGAIQGGNAYNVVPDTCLLRLDRRSLPRENHADIVRAVKARLAALQENGLIHGYNVMVKTDCAAFCTDSDATLIKGLAAACRAHGAEPAINGASWFSDAGPLAKWCREVVVFGPGDIRQAHTIGEYINLEALQKGSDILRTFLQMSAD